LGIASWYAFLPDKDLTMFQVVSILFLEFIIIWALGFNNISSQCFAKYPIIHLES
jgi:hypothetical protein